MYDMLLNIENSNLGACVVSYLIKHFSKMEKFQEVCAMLMKNFKSNKRNS